MTRYLFKKIRDTKGTFHAKMITIKDRNCMDLTEAEDTFKRRQERWSVIPISFENFPQFAVIHTVKGFGTVNKAEVDIFLEASCFF